MSDDYEEISDEELFNDDFDDTETTMRAGVNKRVCPNCKTSLLFRVEGRFVVRYCATCKYETED